VTFLERMASSSRERVRAARAIESEAALERRALAAPAPPPLALGGFDVIAELKLRSPAAGGLAAGGFDRHAQLDAYARGGAAAVSVLTEPAEFQGELGHLVDAATQLRAVHRPAMRKDFLTDPYQVLEARAAGAGGVLVIVTMLDDSQVRALVDCARRCALFVLLEAFDRADLERLDAYDVPDDAGAPLLVGVNCRDLRDLAVRFQRFEELAPYLPRHLPSVAESGIDGVADVRHIAQLGFKVALVGSALMRARDPAQQLAELIAMGRAAQRTEALRCS
jgi:indole-3-glycerol phosphate synthase